MRPRLPDFLVIGAQKCGTTTLYEDLRLHPDIFLAEKESRAMCGVDVTIDELQGRYASAFRSAPPDALFGEVSTRYAMLPDDPEAPINAMALAPELKVIYIVREPVSRVISHHHHDFGLEFVGPDIDDAVVNYPALMDNTRYASQLSPWLDALGPPAARVVRFEDYMADRVTGLNEVLAFIGARHVSELDPGTVAHNAADTKYIAPGRWGKVSQSRIYRRGLRQIIPQRLRRRINQKVLPNAPPRPEPPRPATVRRIVEELRPEVERLAQLTGQPQFWDLDESLERYAATSQ